MKSYGWKNVAYDSYDDLPKDIQSFDNHAWTEKQLNRLNNIDEELDTIRSRNLLLINYIKKYKKNNISVLDYGGGIGLTYFSLLASTDKRIKYNIVELPSICKAGKRRLDGAINFYEDIPNINVDIVYIRTALQYSKDWKKTLSDLIKCNPKYMILAHLSAGKIPTYLTLQKWGDYSIPYWFIDENELYEHIEQYNYDISHLERPYSIDKNEAWETHKALPENLRLTKLLDIVYTRGK
jgi:putative methyltransferase (TIGR04325 family)